MAKRGDEGDLSVTALYTSAVWAWARLPCAELLATKEARGVFRVVNAVMGLVRLFRWRLPSLRHTLLLRHAIIDHLVEGLLTAPGTRQVLELAAGLSRRGATLSARPEVHYVEVDLPAMVARKHELLVREAAGRAVVARPNYRLEAGDATGALDGFVDRAERTIVVAEGLLMYLDPAARRRFWASVADLLGDGGGALVFDLVPGAEEPRPGLLGRVLEWLMKRFTKGAGFDKARVTRQAIVEDLVASGFARVDVFDDEHLPQGLARPDAVGRARTRIVVYRCSVPGSGGGSGSAKSSG